MRLPLTAKEPPGTRACRATESWTRRWHRATVLATVLNRRAVENPRAPVPPSDGPSMRLRDVSLAISPTRDSSRWLRVGGVTVRYAVTRPSAFLPVAMSIAALGVLAWALFVGAARTPDGDEGTAAHVWQLLMAGQLPVIAFFALRWLPVARREALAVLATQLGAGLAATLPVFLLHL